MGRTKTEQSGLPLTLFFRASRELSQQVDRLAAKWDRRRSDVIRLLVRDGVKRNLKEGVKS